MAALIPILCFLLSVFCLPVQAATWLVDPAQSHIEFSGTHAGETFTGVFKSWQADIVFEPALLKQSHATVTVDLTSATTGNPLYDQTLPQRDWFDVKNHPTAVFTTTSFTAQDTDHYTVIGNLTLKNITTEVSFPATITLTNDTATMSGEATLDRLAYGIGQTSDPKGEWVSPRIQLKLAITANRKP